MASEDAFNKRLTTESTMDKVEGLLEHFNLPPKVIDFIRANQKIITVVIVLVVALVVFWSLYGSYLEKTREEAASALSLARQEEEAAQVAAFTRIIEEYPDTASALWARVELGHIALKNGSFAEASKWYGDILAEVKETNPLYPLVLFSLAQSLEEEKRYQEASAQYDLLKGVTGFEQLGYGGLGRLQEVQGNVDKAIAIYNNFLLDVGDDPSFANGRAEMEAKISRLKARQ